MLIFAKRNIVIPAPDGSKSVRVRRDSIEEIPEWATETLYFKALEKDGKIIRTGKSDKAMQEADEKAVKVRRGKE